MYGEMRSYGSDLFDQFDYLRRELDQLFGGVPGAAGIRAAEAGAFPAINVGTSPDRVDVYAFAPGIDPAKSEVSLQQNLLTISGERKEESPEDCECYRRERFNGSFRRVISLPDDVDPDKVNAAYRDGVLHVTIQRREEVKPRRIEVN